MRKLSGLIMLAIIAASCQKNEVVSKYTGTETSYSLQQGSAYAVSGTVTFKEQKDGKITAVIQLTGTEGNVKFPAHLHLGDMSKSGADVALLLNPVLGSTGKSETTFNKLSDESGIDYQRLVELQACVKIHLGDTGPDRDVILAAGNIGSAVSQGPTGGRAGTIGVCKTE